MAWKIRVMGLSVARCLTIGDNDFKICFNQGGLATAGFKSACVLNRVDHAIETWPEPGKTLSNFIPFRSIPFHSVPFRSIPFNSVPFRSIPFNSVQFRSFFGSGSSFNFNRQVAPAPRPE